MRISETHPCFSSCCNGFARIHLPVAPNCNIQCNYCVRKFCCVNESRPGVTTKVMTPQEAADWYRKCKNNMPNLAVAGIAGPGDPLANWINTRETLKLLCMEDKNIKLCLSTNGLMLPDYVGELADLGVKYLTVTLNTIDPKIGGQIYKFVNYNGQKYSGEEAAKILLDRQLAGISRAKANGMTVKINCVAIRGINVCDIVNVANLVSEAGCDLMNIIPMMPVPGSKFAGIKELDNEEVCRYRQECGKYIRQMYHCNRCRADAVGVLK